MAYFMWFLLVEGRDMFVPAALSWTVLLGILSWKIPGSFLAVELLGQGIFKILIHTAAFIMFYLCEKAAGRSLQE